MSCFISEITPPAFDEFGEIFSSANTAAVTALVPATFYFYGLVRKNSYSEQTALLTGEAVLDSEIPAVAIKLITRRLRPNAVSPSADFTDTFFNSPAALINKGGSFPIGPRGGYFLGRHSGCGTIPLASVGSVGRVWTGGDDQLLAGSYLRAFSVRRVSRSRSRLHDRAI
jgi:hypothetical protein